MRNRKLVTLALSATALSGAVLAAPGATADTCTVVDSTSGCSTTGTVSTFSLTSAGGLSLSVPNGTDSAPLALSNTAGTGNATTTTGSLSLAGKLGSVTVTDSRGALTATWIAKVTSTSFTTGGGSTNETVLPTNIVYGSGSPTNDTSIYTGTFTPTVAGLTLDALGTAGAWTGVGNNTVSWNPTLTFTLLPSQVAGTYKGTITHSVI